MARAEQYGGVLAVAWWLARPILTVSALAWAGWSLLRLLWRLLRPPTR